MEAHFEPVMNANCRLVASQPTRRTAIGGYPKVASYDMLGEQLHYSNPVKHGQSPVRMHDWFKVTCLFALLEFCLDLLCEHEYRFMPCLHVKIRGKYNHWLRPWYFMVSCHIACQKVDRVKTKAGTKKFTCVRTSSFPNSKALDSTGSNRLSMT